MDEYSFEAVDVAGQAEEVGRLLKSSLKSKDALLKALKVRMQHNILGPWTGDVGRSASLGNRLSAERNLRGCIYPRSHPLFLVVCC